MDVRASDPATAQDEQLFDAIVVGAGLGGLTAAALCAKAGLKVLVLERNEHCGGAATVCRHSGLDIESSLHEIDGFDDDDPKRSLWKTLGLDDSVKLVDIDEVYEVRGGLFVRPFVLHKGIEAAKCAAQERFPSHKLALERYFERLEAVRSSVSFAARHSDDRSWWLTHLREAARRLWPLLREDNAKLSEVLQSLFGDDELVKIALAANLSYYHDDPAEILFVQFAVPQASYLRGGGHYLKGGSQALADRLVRVIRDAGGQVRTNREAFFLRLVEGAVSGVDHRSTSELKSETSWAPLLFCAASPVSVAEMLPLAKRSGFLEPYAHRRPSVSLWTMAFGIDRPAQEFGVTSYATFIVPDWMKALSDLPASATLMAGEPCGKLPFYTLVDYGRIDSGLNQAGTSILSLCGIDRAENWSGLDRDGQVARKTRWMTALIDDLDRHYPGLAGTITHREMASAETMRRFLHTPEGSVYGFAPARTLLETATSGPRTRLEGLWLASAFGGSGGFTGAMLSGANAARLALAQRKVAEKAPASS